MRCRYCVWKHSREKTSTILCFYHSQKVSSVHIWKFAFLLTWRGWLIWWMKVYLVTTEVLPYHNYSKNFDIKKLRQIRTAGSLVEKTLVNWSALQFDAFSKQNQSIVTYGVVLVQCSGEPYSKEDHLFCNIWVLCFMYVVQ